MRFLAAFLTGLLFCLAAPIFAPVTAVSALVAYLQYWHQVPVMVTLTLIDKWGGAVGPAAWLGLGALLATISGVTGGAAIARILPRTPFECCWFLALIVFSLIVIPSLALLELRAYLWLILPFAIVWGGSVFLGAHIGRPRAVRTDAIDHPPQRG